MKRQVRLGKGPSESSEEPLWLSRDELRAWHGLLVAVLVGMPRIERRFRAYGMVHAEYGMLSVLSERPDGLRLGDLALGASLSQSRVSHRIAKLVDRGLVTLHADPTNHRASIARITGAGRRLVDEIAPLHAEDVRRAFFDGLDARQTAGLADLLDVLSAHLLPGGAGWPEPGATS